MHEPGPTNDIVGGRLRVLQIIAAALLMGVLTFLAVALFLVQQQAPAAPPGGPVLSYVALAFFAIQVGIWALLPASISRRQVQAIAAGTWAPARGLSAAAFAGDVAKLLAVFQTKTIISYALLEGVAFFGGIAYLLEGEGLALAVVAAAVLFMLLTFPTRLRVESWLGQQQARLEELRLRGGT